MSMICYTKTAVEKVVKQIARQGVAYDTSFGIVVALKESLDVVPVWLDDSVKTTYKYVGFDSSTFEKMCADMRELKLDHMAFLTKETIVVITYPGSHDTSPVIATYPITELSEHTAREMLSHSDPLGANWLK